MVVANRNPARQSSSPLAHKLGAEKLYEYSMLREGLPIVPPIRVRSVQYGRRIRASENNGDKLSVVPIEASETGIVRKLLKSARVLRQRRDRHHLTAGWIGLVVVHP